MSATARRAAPEIQQNETAIGANDHVVGQDIAMQEVGPMHHLQGLEQGPDDGVELFRWGSGKLLEPLLEGLAFLDTHHQCTRWSLEHTGDADNGGMLELSERASLLEEVGPAPLECLFMAVGPGVDTHARVAPEPTIRAMR